MNTCIVCLGTVTPTPTGALVLVGDPFLPMAPHTHETTSSATAAPTPIAA